MCFSLIAAVESFLPSASAGRVTTDNEVELRHLTLSRSAKSFNHYKVKSSSRLLRSQAYPRAKNAAGPIYGTITPAPILGFPCRRHKTHTGELMTAVKLEDARRIITAAEKKAKEIGQPMNIAVADEGGNIVAHVRMDDAWIGSIDISMKKAYTSRAFDIETKDLAKHSQSGGQFFGIHASNDGKIMIFAGGIPLKRDGKVVGAIGVSGGSGDQDHAVAAAGAAAF